MIEHQRLISYHIVNVIICCILLLIANTGYSNDRLKLYGNTDYIKHDYESLTTTLTGEYRLELLDINNDGIHDLFLSGKVNNTYDYFGKIMHVNVFTTLQIEF